LTRGGAWGKGNPFVFAAIKAPILHPSKNIERDNALALRGCPFTIKTINQPKVRGNNRGNNRGRMGGAGCVGGCCTIVFEPANPATKNNKNIIHCGLGCLPKNIRHNNQPKTLGRGGGGKE
jgi:hypothetical protein